MWILRERGCAWTLDVRLQGGEGVVWTLMGWWSADKDAGFMWMHL